MPEQKLWIWKNIVDGRPEYWAFDNPYPCYPRGDPMTLGEPCGYAIVKESVNGPPGVPEDVAQQSEPMTDEIEITQEMIDAALNVLWTSDAGAVDEVYYDIMGRVLRAALGTRKEQP